MEESLPSLEKKRGRNVEVVLKFMRHGERTLQGELLDYGREVTAKRAEESGIKKGDYDAVKPSGSNVGPKNPEGMGRSLETAHIYGEQVAGEDVFNTVSEPVMNYETLKSKRPFNHTEIYNSNLPANFNSLSDEEKSKAAKIAQRATINEYFSDKYPDAKGFGDEVAGSFAYLLSRGERMTKYLDNGSKVLKPIGTHGGTMEFLLQRAMLRKDEGGQSILGFKDISEIGGEFDPSEAYNVVIKTDDEGQIGGLKVTFDNPERPPIEIELDRSIVEKLKDYYLSIHPEYQPYEELSS